MQIYQIVLISLASVVGVVAILLLLLAIFCDKLFSGSRQEKNPKLKYFSAEDFNLTANPVSFDSGINGFLYTKDVTEKDEIVIFCHGLGPGHIAYTTEIAFFCNNGYPVLALDSSGCNLSGGKSVRGFYEGVKTAKIAIDYAKASGYKKIYLVGHSMGAYSALCVLKERKVDKVVAISAPLSPARGLCDGAATAMPHAVANMLMPFFQLINFCKFGIKGNTNSARCAGLNGVKTLLIQGDEDQIVPFEHSACYCAKDKNVQKYIANGKGHNPYNTFNAEKALAKIPVLLKTDNDFSDFDFVEVTEEDGQVMNEILHFLRN